MASWAWCVFFLMGNLKTLGLSTKLRLDLQHRPVEKNIENSPPTGCWFLHHPWHPCAHMSSWCSQPCTGGARQRQRNFVTPRRAQKLPQHSRVRKAKMMMVWAVEQRLWNLWNLQNVGVDTFKIWLKRNKLIWFWRKWDSTVENLG